MSYVKANKLINLNGTVRGIPVQVTNVAIPYSAAGLTTTSPSGIFSLSGWTTSNTTLIYSFTYTPVKPYSYIYYTAFLNVDGTAVNSYETLHTFINNNCTSLAYHYRRNTGHEPMTKCQSGQYLNTNGSTLTFSIRGASTASQTNAVGQAYSGGDQGMANRYTIYEVLA
jgi:hypothetical protein